MPIFEEKYRDAEKHTLDFVAEIDRIDKELDLVNRLKMVFEGRLKELGVSNDDVQKLYWERLERDRGLTMMTTVLDKPSEVSLGILRNFQ